MVGYFKKYSFVSFLLAVLNKNRQRTFGYSLAFLVILYMYVFLEFCFSFNIFLQQEVVAVKHGVCEL